MSESGLLATDSPRPVLIFGPTASGKSSLAIAVAERFAAHGTRPPLIINANALQVYDGWRILTARPSAEDASLVEHALYGHIGWSEPAYSAGSWLRECGEASKRARNEGRPIIIVGGTGLYFKVLTQGLAPIPDIPTSTRNRVEGELQASGLSAAARILSERDPETAAKTDLNNPRRVVRALSVLEATGKGMAAWAAETPPPLLPLPHAETALIACERRQLRARIADRLAQMTRTGALDEVSAALRQMDDGTLDWELPAMKALGAAELTRHLKGEISLQTALAEATIATGRYAKRQDTWGRNQCADWRRYDLAGNTAEALRQASEQIADNAARR